MIHAQKKAPQRAFSFQNMTNAQFADMIEREFPISLKYNANLIDRIHARYPILNKTQISVIVKIFFNGIRRILLLGDQLSLDGLFKKTHLFIYTTNFGFNIKLRFSTDKKLRNHDK